jgi:hypothetical protein
VFGSVAKTLGDVGKTPKVDKDIKKNVGKMLGNISESMGYIK